MWPEAVAATQARTTVGAKKAPIEAMATSAASVMMGAANTVAGRVRMTSGTSAINAGMARTSITPPPPSLTRDCCVVTHTDAPPAVDEHDDEEITGVAARATPVALGDGEGCHSPPLDVHTAANPAPPRLVPPALGGRSRLCQADDMGDFEVVVDGVDFGEGPRWHDGRLWYSDFHQRTVFSVGGGGDRRAEHADLDDRPSGLGWLPDGRLLIVAMTSRRLLIADGDGHVSDHADLSAVATGHANDMVVDAAGNAYVGNFGFDYEEGGRFATAALALVRPDGSVETAATGLRFPNGSVITPDGATLIVGESFGAGYEAFTINDDATLGERRRWADVPGMAPDGCDLDVDGGIWFADALGSQVVRVVEGGKITDRLPTPMPVFACALGGDDGRSLFVLCAPGSHPDLVAGKAAGVIYRATIA